MKQRKGRGSATHYQFLFNLRNSKKKLDKQKRMLHLWSVISLKREEYRLEHLESHRKVKKITFQISEVNIKKKKGNLGRKHKQTVDYKEYETMK